MYNFNYVNRRMLAKTEDVAQREFLSTEKIGIKEYDYAFILPKKKNGGGCVTRDLEFIDSSYLHYGVGHAYQFDKESVSYIDEIVVFIGMFNPIWGHCITDNLKHLWFPLDSKYNYLQNYKFLYLNMSSDNYLPNNFYEVLSKLGIDREKLLTVNEVTQFKKVIIPDQCFLYNSELRQRQFTQEYINIVDKILNDIEPSNEQKIYFSRTRLKSHKDFIFSEKKLDKLLVSKGYKIVFPETLTLNEQISLLKGCSEFVTTDGSISHNAIFCKNDTKLVIIRKSDYQNGYQAAINKLKDFNIVYIDSNKSIMCNKKQPWVGPFFVYPDKKFCSYLEIKYKGFPFFSFIVYCLRHLFIKFVRLPKRVIKKVLSLVK